MVSAVPHEHSIQNQVMSQTAKVPNAPTEAVMQKAFQKRSLYTPETKCMINGHIRQYTDKNTWMDDYMP